MGAGSGRSALGAPPPHLTAEEQRAFTICAEGNLRLEQERIPHADIPAYLSPRHEYLAD
jgi:hypothetical protein